MNYKKAAFWAGGVMLAAGLLLEFFPFYDNGHTIPQANSVCSGFGGLFIQGMARAFGSAREGAQVAASCSAATTLERFIGPLIVGGMLLLAAGIVLVVRDRNAKSRPAAGDTAGRELNIR